MKFNLDDQLPKLNNEQLMRISEVTDEQSKIGMVPRNDSILTYNYAISNIPDYMNDAKVIANELLIVDHIYQNTNYGSIIEDVMREIAEHFRFKYRLDWKVTWELVRFYIPDMLKLYCIRKYELKLPNNGHMLPS